jgi:formylmethanofuran dehydrogenase subunit C
MSWTLRLRRPPPLTVDLRGLLPQALVPLDAAAIGQWHVWHGNEALPLGELFDIEPGTADPLELRLQGDLSRFDRLGWGLAGGRIVVDGPVGDHAGAQMSGGEMVVHGAAGLLAGCEMSGGRLVIEGSVGDFAAGALPGSLDGMRGGVLVVRGDAGQRFGDRMRRGTAVVHGDAGDFFASRLVAGTLALGGRCGAHPGYGMRRGSVVFAGPAPSVPPTFVPTRHDFSVFWALLAGDLAPQGGPFAQLAARRPSRHAGDLAAAGQGELLLAGL